MTTWTPEKIAEAQRALREPFPPELIGKLPRKGVQLDFVGHAATTDRLLKVDPTWTWEPVPDPESKGLPMTGTGIEMWIQLTVGGVTRYGYGATTKGDGDGVKECIGDALRNAAMRFGVAIDLWSKEDLLADHEEYAPPPPEPKTRKPREPKKDDAPPKDDLETAQMRSALVDAVTKDAALGAAFSAWWKTQSLPKLALAGPDDLAKMTAWWVEYRLTNGDQAPEAA